MQFWRPVVLYLKKCSRFTTVFLKTTKTDNGWRRIPIGFLIDDFCGTVALQEEKYQLTQIRSLTFWLQSIEIVASSVYTDLHLRPVEGGFKGTYRWPSLIHRNGIIHLLYTYVLMFRIVSTTPKIAPGRVIRVVNNVAVQWPEPRVVLSVWFFVWHI